MSVAPLVERHEAEITKFYVRPPMMAYNKPNAFGQKKQSDEKSGEKKSEEKTRIRSYRELLLNGNDPYKGIYVTADAGMGKTSFAKMLAVTWCEAHPSKDKSVKRKSEMSCADEKQVKLAVKTSAGRQSMPQVRWHYSDGSDADSFYTEDISTMEKFDFLFLIKLREYENSDKCSLYEMIFEKLIPKLQHECRYTREFLENVLCNKRCLIIADGLDEWSHPKPCEKGEVIPHRKQWPGCTVLTTTRPWKLSSALLSKADIDRQVEISQLDETTARELESRAIALLNENQESPADQVAANNNTKTVSDFEKRVPEKILGHILHIPFVLLQIICLWFGNNPIGKSLCEVYSNIIELTLTRWLVKTDSGHTDCKCEPSKEHENIKLKCMENNRHCQCYMPLLVRIGELAFSTLFNVIREESLLFGKEQVLKYLSKKELEQCLKMGLLSQVKDTTFLSEVRLHLYFPHKTLHKYICALCIATNWNNAKTGTMSIKQTISEKCTSVSDILEMSEVFLFVCGLNPEVYSDISHHLATIVSTDQSVIDYRNRVEEDSDLLKDYQCMQISCFLESTRNQHPECKIVIEDMLVDDWRYDDMEEDEKQALESVLTGAAHTLKYLKLERVSPTDDMCSAISTLNNLHALYLIYVDVSSDSLNAVSDCISGCMSLQKLILLFRYKPSDTDEKPEQRETCTNYLLRSIEKKTMLTYLSLSDSYVSPDVVVRHKNGVLDLSRHDKLQELDLRLPLTELHINTEQLVTCEVYRMYGFSVPAVSSLLAELHGALVLETLTLHGIRNLPPRIDITALPLLTKFTLWDCDLRDSTVTLSPEMTSLKTITLREETTVNIPGYRKLFLSISKLPQPITVKLEDIKMTVGEWRELLFDILDKLPKSVHVEMQECRGPLEEEWRNISYDMKASAAFCVTCTDISKVGDFLWETGAFISFDTVVV